MKLAEFARIINQTVENAGKAAEHVEVRISYKNKEYQVRSVEQYSLIPTVYITIGEDTDKAELR